ncbi:hypothetical protein AYO41_01455 [Verrucomicrobia bacterium SCGC AG-212-E04]|nr:hypothetical protein AYO41_01455 [Verrucomicrobia bacterium SCGC AG-212-E04]
MSDAVPPPAPPTPVRPRLGFPAALLGSVVALVLLSVFALWRCERVATKVASQPAEMAERAAQAFKEILQVQPRVTINERVVLNQSATLLELAVLSREVEVEREFEHTWLGSTKRVRLRAVYLIKTGFDLTQPFSIDLSDQPGVAAKVSLPAPKILSTEARRVEVLALENGLWNRVQAENLESEIAALPEEAKRRAQRIGVVREAEESIVKQLSARFPQPPGVTVTIVPAAPPDFRK